MQALTQSSKSRFVYRHVGGLSWSLSQKAGRAKCKSWDLVGEFFNQLDPRPARMKIEQEIQFSVLFSLLPAFDLFICNFQLYFGL